MKRSMLLQVTPRDIGHEGQNYNCCRYGAVIIVAPKIYAAIWSRTLLILHFGARLQYEPSCDCYTYK